MQINFAYLCDHALVDQQGKLSIVGIFDAVQVRNFPSAHAGAFLAYEVELRHAELNRSFELRIELVDEDGGKLMEARMNLQVDGQPPKLTARPPRIPQVLGLPAFPLQKAGRHSFNFWIAGNLTKTLEFDVVQV